MGPTRLGIAHPGIILNCTHDQPSALASGRLLHAKLEALLSPTDKVQPQQQAHFEAKRPAFAVSE